MTTINDIAKAAHVSTATVSRVLNNPELVSEGRRRVVLDAIEALNYAPNALARELVTKSTNVIGLLLPDITNTYAPSVIDSFIKELARNHYNVFVCITNCDDLTEREYIDMMLKKRVEGIALLGSRMRSSANNERIVKISRRMPVVLLDYAPAAEMCCVRTDEEEGAFLATEYLLRLGHRRIGFLNGNERLTTYYHKKQGFERAMQQYGAPVQNKYCITIEPNLIGGYQGAMDLLQLSERPTAVFAAGDQIAVGVYRAAYSSKLSIPDDLSVVGFSGSPISLGVFPALTTVAQFAQETGEEAARLIVSILQGKDVQRQIVFRPKILDRDSCKRL